MTAFKIVGIIVLIYVLFAGLVLGGFSLLDQNKGYEHIKPFNDGMTSLGAKQECDLDRSGTLDFNDSSYQITYDPNELSFTEVFSKFDSLAQEEGYVSTPEYDSQEKEYSDFNYENKNTKNRVVLTKHERDASSVCNLSLESNDNTVSSSYSFTVWAN